MITARLRTSLPSSSPTTCIPPSVVTEMAGYGVVQFAIALVMLADYRRHGVWGAR